MTSTTFIQETAARFAAAALTSDSEVLDRQESLEYFIERAQALAATLEYKGIEFDQEPIQEETQE